MTSEPRGTGAFSALVLGAVLFASFSHQLAGLPTAQVNEALNAVLTGQAGVTPDARAAFDRALRTVLLVTACCALLGGVSSWLWIQPVGPISGRRRHTAASIGRDQRQNDGDDRGDRDVEDQRP